MSATSIEANYEEARGAESRQDFSHKLQIVLKESNYWFKFKLKSEILKNQELNQLIEISRLIYYIIAKSIKTLNNQIRSDSLK